MMTNPQTQTEAFPGETFEDYVARWQAVKREAKRYGEAEMEMRKAIMASIKQARGTEFKEGANAVKMADGRKITGTHKINRSLAQDQIAAVRERYQQLNDRPVDFDDLLKVSYDLVISSFRKLEGEALAVVSDMVTAKEGAPEIKVSD